MARSRPASGITPAGWGRSARSWAAARDLDPLEHDEAQLPGTRSGHLAQLAASAGLREVREATLDADLEHPTFESWWEPFSQGVGPAGAYVARLDRDAREALRVRCRERLGGGPFIIPARAWAIAATA